MPYLSIKKRLKIQYNNKIRTEELLLYRYQYIINKEVEFEDLEDIFDGNIYKDLLEKDLFSISY
ncbi:2885_t:CDS:1, partial [Funneliformis caledonium]